MNIFFDVERGATMSDVSHALKKQKIIYSDVIFRMGANYTDRVKKLKFGQYEIPANASMNEILDIVTRGGKPIHSYKGILVIGLSKTELRLSKRNKEKAQYSEIARYQIEQIAGMPHERIMAEHIGMPLRVIVAEGVSSWQIMNALQSVNFLTGKILTAPKEGHLATGAYEIKTGHNRSDLIEKMEQRQEVLLLKLWANKQQGLPFKSAYEALILASIIEKETPLSAEHKVIASVFINRLNRGIRLQSDPTIIYGITHGKGNLGRALLKSDIAKKTPWNTYRINGLPPTPITNPGIKAIRAALNPEKTEYMYFVADGKGGHVFSKTITEHNENVRKWRGLAKQNF